MIKKVTTNEGIQYKKLSPDEMKARGILGRLIGPCADFNNATRNGRKYSEKLWENVFNDPIMQEKIKNGVCFGELGHPEDRTEIDMEKIAVCLREQPVKNEKGQLCAVFDILDTPNGRILKTLCDYGSTVGVSSRGQGDLITDINGNEAVDPDTYECECWDVVLVPAVESARMKYVTEGLNNNKNRLKRALKEDLNKATEDEKKIMNETLKNLKINLTEESKTEDKKIGNSEDQAEVDNKEDVEKIEDDDVLSNSDELDAEDDDMFEARIFTDYLVNNFAEKQVKKVCKILDLDFDDLEDFAENEDVENTDEEKEEIPDDIKVDDSNKEIPENEEAVDDGDEVLVKSLQEAIVSKANLENDYKSLQEKLAVSDTKVSQINEECNKYKQAVVRLSEICKSTKNLKKDVSQLEKSVKEKDELIESQKARIARLVKSRKDHVNESNNLSENLNSKSNEINKLNENLNKVKKDSETRVQELTEQFKNKEAEINKKVSELKESLNKTQSIKESYKKLATTAVNKYIEIKATMLGVTSSDIKRKLGESYTLTDVDEVCEDLKSYQLNVSKLPFSIDRKVGIKVNEAYDINKNQKSSINSDDDVDDSLIRLANLN